MRPLCQKLQHRDINGDGRSDRAFLQGSVTASIEPEGIRCVKTYSIVVLTGTDALPLDTLVRPYRVQSRLVLSGSAFVVSKRDVVLWGRSNTSQQLRAMLMKSRLLGKICISLR